MNKCCQLTLAVILVLSLTHSGTPAETDVVPELIEAARARTDSGFGDVAKARQLLDGGANPDLAGKYGWTALHYAAGWGNLELVQLLISKGANPNSASTIQSPDGTPVRTTPLHVVSSDEIASILIKAGADITARNGSGQTPLHHAAAGSSNVVEMLLKKGANPNAQDSLGRTPLHECLEHARYSWPAKAAWTANLLLKAGCRLDNKDNSGRTALDLCTEPILTFYLLRDYSSLTPFDALRLEDSDLLKKLVRTKAQANADKHGHSILQQAANDGRLPEVQYLVQLGADVNYIRSKNEEFRTPVGLSIMEYYETALVLALNEGHWDVARFLVENGAETNLVGHTTSMIGLVMVPKTIVPLNCAARNGQLELVKAILQRGAKVDATTPEAVTPLMDAAGAGNLSIVKLLVGAGANVALKDNQGKTAEELASEKGHTEIVKYLQSN